MTRRNFLKLASRYAALTGASTMGFPLSLSANNTSSVTGYKALVILLQHGGNDSINMFIPSGDDAKSGYDNYASIRTTLKVDNENLALASANTPLVLSSGALNPYASNGSIRDAYTKGFYQNDAINGLAVNGLMPELAHLLSQEKVALLSNVGNLIQPTTKQDILAKTANLPPFLYSHNSQRKLTFNGVASVLDRSGWAGLVSDDWSQVNNGSIYGMNISLKGTTHLLQGKTTSPLVFGKRGPTQYKSAKRNVYDNWMNIAKNEKFTSFYNDLRQHSFNLQDVLVDDWNNITPPWTSSNAYGGDLFSPRDTETLGIKSDESLSTGLLAQLESVAKWAYIGKQRGLKRQIFYVQQGGYDTHANQTLSHGKLLRELSIALGDFQLAVGDMGMEEEVTLFNHSDFGRSIGNNGDGTDHAWGGHHFVLGGAVKGGLYGTLPDLTLGGEDDLTQKGRLIPSTSMSQYLATLVKWFGADAEMLAKLFPELKNFSQQDLEFMA